MFVSIALLAAAQLNQVVVPFGKQPRIIEQPVAPIATSGPAFAATCKDWDEWNKPAPPVRIHANTYLVGTCGISSILIIGDQGDILIDGGPEDVANLIAANIRAVGVRLQNIKYILTSHEHSDHAGGIARLQELTGASVITSASAARVIASGTPAADDPQIGVLKSFPGARVGRIVNDGDQVRLGNLMLTAIATPGHTPGALSWTWVSCDGGVCRTIVYADSLSAVSNDKYRFIDHPAYVSAFRASIAKVAATPCDILLTPHPSASDMVKRLGTGKPLLDPDACRNYAAQLTRNLDARLAKEAAAK
jgi:metallo-beta-lactamase class B